MFKQKTIVALVSLALSPALFAGQTTVQAEEVVVTATRTATPVSKVLSDVTVITREEIEETGATQLTELLARQPGVEVASNGGMGTSSSVFMRGANSNHTLILVDGMRIVSASAGTTALQQIPLDLIDRVEILRGPASSLYGADAIGGVIQIFTRKGEGAPKFSANLGFGERGTTIAGMGINGKVADTAFGINLSHQSTNGFSAQSANSDSEWGLHNPDRDAYRENAYSAYLTQTLAAGHTLTVRSFQTSSNVEYDVSEVNQDEIRGRLSGQSIELQNKLTDIWSSTLRFARTQDKQEGFDDGQMDIRASLFDTTQNEWLWQNDVATKLGALQLGLVHTEQNVDGVASYMPNGFTVTRRTNKAAFAGYTGDFGPHLLQASLRHDDNSQFGGKTTGQVSYGYRFADGWLARAGYGTAFQAPTFNNLYGSYKPNPNLKPEEATNYEAGLRWTNAGHRAELTWFQNTIDNLIIYQGMSNNMGAVNRDARIEGVTLAGESSMGALTLSGSATWQDPEDRNTGKQLLRRAHAFGQVNVSYDWGRWISGAEYHVTASRPDYGAELPGYAKLNLYADMKLAREWTATARIENVADRDYENAYGYNTGGRTWFVGVRYQPK
ncbi:TonB-dependent receptor domain-containing protein [Craterilacuibacter sinensis]|uniref:TonB-dependent receptor n=1 Tax=Craterilacuibacter sinensis TaxID=2686017 RepID=A0A845BLV2_9NEIS|nr:TonB-dependent receptor [Craterilacuibacter sinensis]MXR36380.1 TonB-dependent receptor [Craterilacuibacter sinensis]